MSDPTVQGRQAAEREKFDAIAHAGRQDLHERLASFDAYVRGSSYLCGVSDFLGDVAGRQVLDLGCGTGRASTLLARSGASVTAVDISPASIDVARQRAEVNGVRQRITFWAGGAEEIPFEDESFDLVFGSAILHHVEPELVGPQIRRVMRTGARAAFSEPLGTNPVVRFARARLPYRFKAPRGTDEPLRDDDLVAWARWFDSCTWSYAHLLGMAERLVGWRWHFGALHDADRFLLSHLPVLRPLANVVVIFGTKSTAAR